MRTIVRAVRNPSSVVSLSGVSTTFEAMLLRPVELEKPTWPALVAVMARPWLDVVRAAAVIACAKAFSSVSRGT